MFFHLHTKPSLIAIVAIEILLLITRIFPGNSIFRTNRISRIHKYTGRVLQDFFTLHKTTSLYYVRVVFFCISIIVITLALQTFLKNLGNIFSNWDAVVSWNRWAVDFFNNKFPGNTYHYPQLLPANWSISYVLMNYPFQYVARGIMPLFLIFILVLQFTNGVKSKSISFLVSVPLTYIIFQEFVWTDGYADVALAFFTLLSVDCLYRGYFQEDKGFKKYISLGAIFACGAAVTKQGGLFLVIIYPILVFIFSRNKKYKLPSDWLGYLVKYLIVISLTVLPFYIYTEIRIMQGLEESEISAIAINTNLHQGLGYFQRIRPAFIRFTSLFNNISLQIAMLGLWILSFFNKFHRAIALVIVVPFYIIWSIFFSYDIRNTALFVPLFCIGIGGGFEYILTTFLTYRIQLFKKPTVTRIAFSCLIFTFVCIVMIIANQQFPYGRLYNNHISKEKKIGDSSLNAMLYKYDDDYGINKKVITDYQYFGFLPDLENYYLYINIRNLSPTNPLLTDKEVGFLLLTPYTPELPAYIEMIEYVNQKVEQGEYELIFSHNGYTFVKLTKYDIK